MCEFYDKNEIYMHNKEKWKDERKTKNFFVFFPKIFSLIFEFFFFLFVGFTLNYLQNDTF